MIVSFCADVVLKEVYTIIGKVNHTSFCCNIKPASQCYYAAGILSDLIVRMLVCVGHHRRSFRFNFNAISSCMWLDAKECRKNLTTIIN